MISLMILKMRFLFALNPNQTLKSSFFFLTSTGENGGYGTFKTKKIPYLFIPRYTKIPSLVSLIGAWYIVNS